MNAVVFYSNTGQSESVANRLAGELGYPCMDIEKIDPTCYENLILVFPVHCQNIPAPVKDFLKAVKIEYLSVIATYGNMCHGNVLYEIQRKYHKNVIAGAYVPTKHAYVENDVAFCDFERLTPIVRKIQNPSVITLPKLLKNPLADLFPKLRSRLGLKIRKNERCNGCDLCGVHCSFKAIRSGTTNHRCIRCLRCVRVCPRKALEVRLGFSLRLYLRKKKANEIIVYV